MAANIQELLNRVPTEHKAEVSSLVNQLATILGNFTPVIAWVESYLPQILALLSSGFSLQSIMTFILNIFPPQPAPTPAPVPAPAK